jgi:hypothetical protein
VAADWARFCRTAGLRVVGDTIIVKLAENRHHRVTVRDSGATYELQAIVARTATLNHSDDIPLLAWRRNRSSQLVGYRVDQRNRLIGEAWVPKAGLTTEEFRTYVLRLASECDRFEYLLTGMDSE